MDSSARSLSNTFSLVLNVKGEILTGLASVKREGTLKICDTFSCTWTGLASVNGEKLKFGIPFSYLTGLASVKREGALKIGAPLAGLASAKGSVRLKIGATNSLALTGLASVKGENLKLKSGAAFSFTWTGLASMAFFSLPSPDAMTLTCSSNMCFTFSMRLWFSLSILFVSFSHKSILSCVC